MIPVSILLLAVREDNQVSGCGISFVYMQIFHI